MFWWLVLCIALGMQWAFSTQLPFDWQRQTHPPAPPAPAVLSAITLGERAAAATGMVLYAQSFDAQAGRAVPIKSLNISRLQDWLEVAAELNPRSAYPSFLSSRLYAEQASTDLTRQIIDWITSLHQKHPETHWPALAHAVHLARHRLNDWVLAREVARELRLTPLHVKLPPWARQMEAFMQANTTELEDAQALIGGLIASGQVTDERAIAVLLADLKTIEERLRVDERSQDAGGNAETLTETFSVGPGTPVISHDRDR